MKIAIIGAGFAGLAAGLRLAQNGHAVTLFEREEKPGGLALGFKEKRWAWSLEKHYHHWFTNDSSVLDLAKELQHKVIVARPKTSVFLNGAIYQLDSPIGLLKFPELSLMQRLRMATVLASLRYNPFWQPLEHIHVTDFLACTLGKEAYEKIWEPLLTSKFGKYKDTISLAWFWARIRKRTASLAYPKEGFLEFAKELQKNIEELGGKFFFKKTVGEVKSQGGKCRITCFNDLNHSIKTFIFDKIIVTLPSFVFLKIAPQLPQDYREKLCKLRGLGAINLVLSLKEPFLTDGTYWLNICDKGAPIMAIVEHTNFMDKKYYNNEHIVYLGNYLTADHRYMKMTAQDLLDVYHPFLKKINPAYRLSLISYHLFKVPFAQPIIPTNYSKIMPAFQTPLKNVYLANIQQVYPWDRGTNYAVELGEKVARMVTTNEH